MVRVVRCSSRDALETADASRLVRARFREGRNRRRIESAATTRGGKLRERERERKSVVRLVTMSMFASLHRSTLRERTETECLQVVQEEWIRVEGT